MADKIQFTYNWNNKLHCKAFTTLRLSNEFGVGGLYEVWLNKVNLGKAVLVEKRKLKLFEINEFIAFIDTGYQASECKEILMKMYKKRKVNWITQNINFLLFSYVDRDKHDQPEFEFGSEDANEVYEEHKRQALDGGVE